MRASDGSRKPPVCDGVIGNRATSILTGSGGVVVEKTVRRVLVVLLVLCVLAAGCSGGSPSDGVGITGGGYRPAAADAIGANEAAGELHFVNSAPGESDAVGISEGGSAESRLLRDQPDWYDFEVETEEGGTVVVVPGSVTIRDCVVRGLVQNRSPINTIGFVIVSIHDEESAIEHGLNTIPELVTYSTSKPIWSTELERPEQPVDGYWEWPLAMPPGSIAPFEITGWPCAPGMHEVFARVRGTILNDTSNPGEINPWMLGDASLGYAYPLAFDIKTIDSTRQMDDCPSPYLFGPDVIIYDERIYELPDWTSMLSDCSLSMIHKDIFLEGFLDSITDDIDWSFPTIRLREMRVSRNLAEAYPELVANCEERIYLYEEAIYQAVMDSTGGVVDVRKAETFYISRRDSFLPMSPYKLTDLCLYAEREYELWKPSGNSQFLGLPQTLRFIPLSSPPDIGDASVGVAPDFWTHIWAGEVYFPTDLFRIPNYIAYVAGAYTGQFDNWTRLEVDAHSTYTVGQNRILDTGQGTISGHMNCDVSGSMYIDSTEENGEPSYQLMGYTGRLTLDDTANGIDELVVERDTVSIAEGVVRGLVHNQSATRSAVDVKVEVSSHAGLSSLGEWVWPLTLQPGERAPFELEGLLGIESVSDLQFQVSGTFTQCLDLSRAFKLTSNLAGSADEQEVGSGGYNSRYWDVFGLGYQVKQFFSDGFERLRLDVADLELYFPDFAFPSALLAEERVNQGDRVGFTDYYVRLQAPDSHPHLEEQINNLVIDDLQAYVAFFDYDGRVIGVERLNPYTATAYHPDGSRDYAPSNSIPNANPEYPSSLRVLVTSVEGYHGPFQVWIGGANGS